MRLSFVTTFLLAAALGALAACGKSGSGAAPGEVDACALIADSAALFGAGAESTPGAPIETMAGACSWHSADGRRGGDLIVYTANSLRGATPASQFTHFTESWDAMSEAPLAPVAGVGDEAQIAMDLPGYQTQIVIRKGDKVAALQAWSGDPAFTSDALARRMAQAAVAGL